jgi:hypothetical protein
VKLPWGSCAKATDVGIGLGVEVGWGSFAPPAQAKASATAATSRRNAAILFMVPS